MKDYSKPSGDLAAQCERLLADNNSLLSRQREIATALDGQPRRQACLLCAAPLAEVECFVHRGIDYLVCKTCDHIQTRAQPPKCYPQAVDGGQTFDEIYPRLGAAEVEERTAKIYTPKLDWLLRCTEARGNSWDTLLDRTWVELGSGAGYFVNALRHAGARDIVGLEANAALVAAANEALGAPLVRHFEGSLPDALREYPADVYCAWFVLEHLDDAQAFWSALGDSPVGTIFAFAVPTFGLATVLESVVGSHFARQLDSVFHTQLYTPESIGHALERAGFEILSEWIFGQDALDFYRMLAIGIEATYPRALRRRVLNALNESLDAIQGALDRAEFADARHVLAIKR